MNVTLVLMGVLFFLMFFCLFAVWVCKDEISVSVTLSMNSDGFLWSIRKHKLSKCNPAQGCAHLVSHKHVFNLCLHVHSCTHITDSL